MIIEFLILGFFTGLSLILAIGAQNIFVIEQGLRKQYVLLVCLVCSISDVLLIFVGILLFHYFQQYFSTYVEILLNVLLIIFLIYFIYLKIKILKKRVNFDSTQKKTTKSEIFFETLGFTYLNAHVYSDTVFFLGNFSKSFNIENKIYFGIGASIASFLFFFSLGYLSKVFSNKLNNRRFWKYINIFIIIFMLGIVFKIIRDIIY